MLTMMREEKVPMTDDTWSSISSDAKDFIRGLLKFNPEERLPIDAVVKHPWLQTPGCHSDPATSERVLSNLRRFSNTSRLFSICMASAATQLDHRSLRDVEAAFREMDADGDGVLTLSEVKSAFEKTYASDSIEMVGIEEMFARLDLDGSGEIDYMEFCAAHIGLSRSDRQGRFKTADEQALRAAFKTFDVDDSGEITKTELADVLDSVDMSGTLPVQSIASDLMRNYDKDKSGSLNVEEWLKFVRASSPTRSPSK